jgi:hypothetical protein
VVYTLVSYQPGLPRLWPNSPPFRPLVGSPTLLQGTPAVEVIDDIAPRPDEPVVSGQTANGFDGAAAELGASELELLPNSPQQRRGGRCIDTDR